MYLIFTENGFREHWGVNMVTQRRYFNTICVLEREKTQMERNAWLQIPALLGL